MMPPKRKIEETEFNDEIWVEGEGRKLTDEEFQERLKKAPVMNGYSKTIEEFAAEHGIDLNEVDDED